MNLAQTPRWLAPGILLGLWLLLIGHLSVHWTVNPQYSVAAKHMVEMLERLIQGESLHKSERVVKIEPVLVPRESA